jgi:hypothetical protein
MIETLFPLCWPRQWCPTSGNFNGTNGAIVCVQGSIHFRRQGGKVDRRFDLGKRTAQRVDLLPVMLLGKSS